MASIHQTTVDKIQQKLSFTDGPLTGTRLQRWCYLCGNHCHMYSVKSYQLELFTECLLCNRRVFNTCTYKQADRNGTIRVASTTARHKQTIARTELQDDSSYTFDSGESRYILENLTYYVQRDPTDENEHDINS